MPHWLASRLPYIGLAIITIAIGLAVHFGGRMLSPTARDISGDALWAMMIAWWVGAAAPRASITVRSVVALTICWAVEASQLYHIDSLDAIRRTSLGHLVLGSDFDARDLAAYAMGVAFAAMIVTQARRRWNRT